jgi:hypothetical protein
MNARERVTVSRGSGQFDDGDRVITPSDEVAIVQGCTAEGFVALRYKNALVEANAGLNLHERLLVRWDRDKPRPKPVKIARGA